MSAVTGDCGPVAAQLVTDPSAPASARLVHGYALGRGGDAEGLRYWHAWAEVVIAGRTWCVDQSNGLNVTMRRAAYYELGDVRDVTRYTAEEARKLMAETGHYGPWDGTVLTINPATPATTQGD